MSTTTVVKVKVQELTKYGFKANDRYVGLSKNLSEADKTKLVPGAEFEAEVYIADSGKEYLNKILVMSTSSDSVKVQPAGNQAGVDTERAKKFTPKFEKKSDISISAGLSKDEWAAKDRRISRQGCIQVAVQVQSNFEEAVKLAEQMLEFVNQ